MARSFAWCLLLLTTLIPFAASSASPLSSGTTPATGSIIRVCGFDLELESNHRGDPLSLMAESNCLLSARSSSAGQGSVVQNDNVDSPQNVSGKRPFARRVFKIFRDAVLSFDPITGHSRRVSEMFAAAVKTASYHRLCSIEGRADLSARGFESAVEAVAFQINAFELFREKSNNRSSTNRADERQPQFRDVQQEMNPAFVEMPDEYWSYYRDCDRWNVQFQPAAPAELSRPLYTKVAAESYVAARDLVKEISSEAVGVAKLAEFHLVESPLNFQGAGDWLNNESQNVERTGIAPVAAITSLLRTASRSIAELDREPFLNQARNLYAAAEKQRVQESLNRQVQNEQRQLKRYLASPLKWFSQRLDSIANDFAGDDPRVAQGQQQEANAEMK